MSYVPFGTNDKRTLTETLTTSTWTNNQNNLNAHYTASTGTALQQLFNSPTSSAWFYLNVYQTSSADATAEVQYTVSYGNRLGSGSPDFTNDTGSMGNSATKTIYSQYQSLVYGDDTTKFTFGTHTPEDIYIINIARSRFKQALKPGSLNLVLSCSLYNNWDNESGTNTGAPSVGDGSHKLHKFTDDSVSNSGSAVMTKVGRQYNIVSGANGIQSGSFITQQGGSSSYGLFYPDAGFIILNPDMFGYALGTDGGLRPQKNQGLTDNSDKNNEKLFQAIAQPTYGVEISPGASTFILDSEEDVSSQYYFARARNYEFNYTNNSTFVDGNGVLKYSSMIDNPKVYITTVGLYNDNMDLLAVAKLSQPIAKDITKEALIRIKLDY
jgi:hypothetical protein